MDGTPYVNLTIDSTDGQLRVEGPFSLLRTYVRAFVANDATEPDQDTVGALAVAVIALTQIRDASPAGGPIAQHATTALNVLGQRYGLQGLISDATRVAQSNSVITQETLRSQNGGPHDRRVV